MNIHDGCLFHFVSSLPACLLGRSRILPEHILLLSSSCVIAMLWAWFAELILFAVTGSLVTTLLQSVHLSYTSRVWVVSLFVKFIVCPLVLLNIIFQDTHTHTHTGNLKWIERTVIIKSCKLHVTLAACTMDRAFSSLSIGSPSPLQTPPIESGQEPEAISCRRCCYWNNWTQKKEEEALLPRLNFALEFLVERFGPIENCSCVVCLFFLFCLSFLVS